MVNQDAQKAIRLALTNLQKRNWMVVAGSDLRDALQGEAKVEDRDGRRICTIEYGRSLRVVWYENIKGALLKRPGITIDIDSSVTSLDYDVNIFVFNVDGTIRSIDGELYTVS